MYKNKKWRKNVQNNNRKRVYAQHYNRFNRRKTIYNEIKNIKIDLSNLDACNSKVLETTNKMP